MQDTIRGGAIPVPRGHQSFDGTPLARWVLSGVFPTKWSIESDSADADVPIETLVLQYERIHLVSR